MNAPRFPDGRTVTLVRQQLTGTDVYGNDTYAPVSTDVPGATWWPRYSKEDDTGRVTVTEGVTLLLPPGVALDPVDRVLLGGEEFGVLGEPAVWGPSPFTGSSAGVQVELERVSG